MKRKTINFLTSLILAVVFLSASNTWAELDFGEYTISGSTEVDGLPGGFSGDRSKFETYRDVPESVVVPQLQLMIGGKKQDFYLNFDALSVGRDDQNYRLRFGRYGLLDVELEWDQIPHIFNIDNARTPYIMRDGRYTLRSRPTAVDGPSFSNWIRDPDNTRSVDLDVLNKIGRISIRYTPNPGWTFTGKYWQQNTDGRRAISFPFGSGSSSNIAELAEPIDYQTHNIELGGEYAGKWWSLGLKYNGSMFHNSISTLVFDNPANPDAGGGSCVDYAGSINYTTRFGPCQGRVDLYPSNQAHTFTLTGTANLPLKTNFLGTVSYGWRLQDDSFLPFTINSAIAEPLPGLSRGSLDGDVRPTMINLTLVNNFVDRLNLKAYYRLYNLDNRTKSVLTSGTILNDQGAEGSDWTKAKPYEYSKNSAGLGATYRYTQWLTGKFNFSWERTHREIPQLSAPFTEALNADEFKIGPTFDIRPLSWLLFRAAYQHSWRFAPDYSGSSQMFWLTKRNQDKVSLFADISPWETLSFHGGFDYISDNYPDVTFRLKNAQNYSPSVGFLYAPMDWLKFFGDYNFDHYTWNQAYSSNRHNRGKDTINTFSLGSDVDLIKNVLAFRIQYGFSHALSQFSNKLSPDQQNPKWPNNTNTWQELLARFEYQLHKNIAVQLGYYFNKFNSKDYGVDIMELWMGDYDNNPGILRSVFLGDRFKGNYTAHIALLGLKIKF